MGDLLYCIGEGRIRDEKIFPHSFGGAETNVGDEALLGIGADIFAIAFTGMVRVFEFMKASNEGTWI